MATPESRTKGRIKALLDRYGCWWYMPQQFGMGDTHLDFICARPIRTDDGTLATPADIEYDVAVRWEIFFIEAKAHGEDPTPRQWVIINRERKRGFKVFVCDDENKNLKPKHDSLKDIEGWLTS